MEGEGLTKDEFNSLVEEDFRIIKKTNIVSDGKNLLVRIPKKICLELELKKKDSIEWICDPKLKTLTINLNKDG